MLQAYEALVENQMHDNKKWHGDYVFSNFI
jgi:hypothetical protein